MPVNAANAFGLHEYDFRSSFFGGHPYLSQGVGYGIVVGFGILFSLFTSAVVWIDYKYGGTRHSSEQFNTAGRTIRTGLTAADIVSKWTWAATLLQSSNVAYKFGVSGPFWYAGGASIQVLLFGILAVQVKRVAPRAHTVLEIVRARWGLTAHKVFFFFCVLTNVIVSSMLLLGGAAVMQAVTGMDIYAAAFLIPIGVVMYTAIGGLKATFLASYTHTVYIYVILLLFGFTVYASDANLGSPAKVWENLTAMQHIKPVDKNQAGSYLTMRSTNGLIFGIINVVGNFGTVFVDQAYWQSAIAAKPSAAYKGYMLGGICWFSIPFTLATSLGLAATALDLPITLGEANSGLVPPAVAVHLLGKGGAIALVIMLFMAVTSAGSAELIAMSSLFSYDIYKTYINPRATGESMVRVSQYAVVGYGCFMGVLAVVLLKATVSLGWMYEAMGTLIGGAVIPIALCLCWRKTNKVGAMVGAVAGLLGGVTIWLVWAKVEFGELSLATTGSDYPMLAGNLMSILLSGAIVIGASLAWPENYDFESMKQIEMLEEDGSDKLAAEGADSMAGMNKAMKWMLIYGTAVALIILVIWPIAAVPVGVFPKGYFTMWVVISLVWGIVAAFLITFLPPWEARATLWRVTYHSLTCTPLPPQDDPSHGKFVVQPKDAAPKGAIASIVKPEDA